MWPCSSSVRAGEQRAGVWGGGKIPYGSVGAAEEGVAVQSEVKGGRFEFKKKKKRRKGKKKQVQGRKNRRDINKNTKWEGGESHTHRHVG